MKSAIKKLLRINVNESARIAWVSDKLASLSPGSRVLDAGAGEQRFRAACSHLDYVAQDFGQYNGRGDSQGLHTGTWNYGGIDIVCDIASIPEPDGSFDAVLCTEVLEHIPDPLLALNEFSRLLRSGGVLILTVPFASLVHFAPYFFSTGLSRYWYEYHLPRRGLGIDELTANGDWYDLLYQEILRLPSIARRQSLVHAAATVPFVAAMVMLFMLRRFAVPPGAASDVGALGYHCVARKL